jgi:hypothetical protein
MQFSAVTILALATSIIALPIIDKLNTFSDASAPSIDHQHESTTPSRRDDDDVAATAATPESDGEPMMYAAWKREEVASTEGGDVNALTSW